jgi:mRNA interferase MazF
MTFKRGDIYLCRFTGEGSEPQGKRPCIVVSNNRNNKFAPTVNVVPLTRSTTKPKLPVHAAVECAGMASVSLAENITTVSKERLYEPLGRVTEAELAEVSQTISRQLGL